jgi:hypothetical protein
VEPIALYPVTHSNGEVVFEQLEQTTEKTGVPREILGDHGSDLKAGIERFVQAHPQACYIYDIKHKGATLLKGELDKDEIWKAFTQKAAQTKSQVQQTALAFLNPPNQRTKARYMNLAILIRWAQRVLSLLDKLEKSSRNPERYEKLAEKLGWLREFREPLGAWAALLKLVITTEEFVRTQGLAKGCEAELEKRLVADVDTPNTRRVREQLLAFVKDQSLKAKPNECLPGSSEIIESVLGKLKQLEQNQAKSGFTSLVLGVAAIVSKTTQEVVQRAMKTVPTKKVIEWSKTFLGQSVQAKRKIAFGATNDAEQIWDHLFEETLS